MESLSNIFTLRAKMKIKQRIDDCGKQKARHPTRSNKKTLIYEYSRTAVLLSLHVFKIYLASDYRISLISNKIGDDTALPVPCSILVGSFDTPYSYVHVATRLDS